MSAQRKMYPRARIADRVHVVGVINILSQFCYYNIIARRLALSCFVGVVKLKTLNIVHSDKISYLPILCQILPSRNKKFNIELVSIQMVTRWLDENI